MYVTAKKLTFTNIDIWVFKKKKDLSADIFHLNIFEDPWNLVVTKISTEWDILQKTCPCSLPDKLCNGDTISELHITNYNIFL